ncbi:MAG: hypothetical protein ACTSO2_16810 [Promethearchaeota archaeon]
MRKAKIVLLFGILALLIPTFNSVFNSNFKSSLYIKDNIRTSSPSNLIIVDWKNQNSSVYVKLSWANNNSQTYEYFALYRYAGDPLEPETENISLFTNLKIFEFVDIPNIGHPYYMVRGYYANGSYADSNIVDVELGEIPMFVNPEYEIKGNTISFSVWCKENPGVGDIFLLYRFRKEGDDWKCIEDMPEKRSPHADSSSVMENNWTRYEWYNKGWYRNEKSYSTYVWFNFYHELKKVYWVPDRYANGTFNYEQWGRTEAVYAYNPSLFQLIYLFIIVFAQIFIVATIYLYFRFGKKIGIIAYLMLISIKGGLYAYFEIRFANGTNSFDISLFGCDTDKYSEGLILNRSLLIYMIFSLCQWIGLMPFIVLKVDNLEKIKRVLIEKYGEKEFIKRGINLIMFQREIKNLIGFFVVNLLIFIVCGIYDLLYEYFGDYEYFGVFMLAFLINLISFDIRFIGFNFIFFHKIEKINNFGHFGGEINEYYENCKRAFKLYRKMLIPIFIMFLAFFISNYMLFHSWLISMNS